MRIFCAGPDRLRRPRQFPTGDLLALGNSQLLSKPLHMEVLPRREFVGRRMIRCGPPLMLSSLKLNTVAELYAHFLSLLRAS
jgi:hypothetical protein